MSYVIKSIISERLLAARIMRGLSQKELARRARMHPAAISHWETGNRQPSIQNLYRLISVLEVSCDYLLGRAEDPNPVMNDDPFYRSYENLTIDDRYIARRWIGSMVTRGEMRDRADESNKKNERLRRSYEVENAG